MFFISNSVLSVYDCDNNYDYKDDQEIEEQNERGVGLEVLKSHFVENKKKEEIKCVRMN